MQHVFSIIAAAGALAMPQTGIATNAPLLVSTCAVSDLYNPATMAEFGPSAPYRVLRLGFINTDDTVATKVTFDVAHDGAHTMVTDRGRFSRGVTIERNFDELTGTYGSGQTECAVTAITYADGRHWTAARGTTNR